MRYYIDTEFNGNHGQLLSMAMVAENGNSLYLELPLPVNLDPWVARHVVPLLKGDVSSWEMARVQVHNFLARDHTLVKVIADWPEDLSHFLNILLSRTEFARSGPTQLQTILLDLPGFKTADTSKVPHHALYDAVALMQFVEQGLKDGVDGALTVKDLRALGH